MLTNNTLWALASNTEIWYSFDHGTTWNQVDVSGLSGWINGLWGPTNTWKIYVGVADDATYYYDGSWHLEDSSGPWYYTTRYRPESQTIWCSDDDSIVCAAGFDSSYNNVIRTRDGLPGTSWVDEYVVAYNAGGGDSYITDIHGTPDGSAIFAIRSYVGSNYDVELLKRNSDGSWSEVASITDGDVSYWQQVRVISETEVWITGAYDTPNSARIWKWDGTTLSLEYSDTDIRSRGIVGLWMAKDGSEGWALYQVNGPSSESDYFLYYDGSIWSVFQGVQYGTLTSDITQLDDYSASAIALLINGRYRKYDGVSWDTTYSYSGSNNDIWDETSSASGLILRYISYEESYDPPFVEGRMPASGGINISLSSNIECLIVDPNSNIYGNSIDAYVDGNLAYDGSSNTFITPYDGINSSLTYMPASSIDGYDGYYLVLDRSLDFGPTTLYAARVLFEDAYGNAIDESWSFTTTTAPIIGSVPFITNMFPTRNESNASPSTLIFLDVIDVDGYLKQDGLRVLINRSVAFSATQNSYEFFYPYNSSDSKFYSTNVDGYDGYHVEIDSYNSYYNLVTVEVDGYDNSSGFSDSWAFIVNQKINSVYFNDGYGLKRIDIQDFVGEAQSSILNGGAPLFTKARNVAESLILFPTISSIFSNFIDGYLYLSICYSPNNGVTILKNELTSSLYLDGYLAKKAQINDDGTLYVVNETLNQIEVYYGATFRDGYRSPDYIYNNSSTPSIVSGTISDLHVVSGYSTKYSGGTRLYIGTTQGVTRIEAYDKGTDGYSDGEDYRGVSIHYGISGSGLQHESIGGSVTNVVSVNSNDDENIMFVGTFDGLETGGVTQISIPQNRKVIFMTKENGLLPSNNIRSILGKMV